MKELSSPYAFHEGVRGSRVASHIVSVSKLSASSPIHFPLRERSPTVHKRRGWVGFRAHMGVLGKVKVSWPCWELNHNSSALPAAT